MNLDVPCDGSHLQQHVLAACGSWESRLASAGLPMRQLSSSGVRDTAVCAYAIRLCACTRCGCGLSVQVKQVRWEAHIGVDLEHSAGPPCPSLAGANVRLSHGHGSELNMCSRDHGGMVAGDSSIRRVSVSLAHCERALTERGGSPRFRMHKLPLSISDPPPASFASYHPRLTKHARQARWTLCGRTCGGRTDMCRNISVEAECRSRSMIQPSPASSVVGAVPSCRRQHWLDDQWSPRRQASAEASLTLLRCICCGGLPKQSQSKAKAKQGIVQDSRWRSRTCASATVCGPVQRVSLASLSSPPGDQHGQDKHGHGQ